MAAPRVSSPLATCAAGPISGAGCAGGHVACNLTGMQSLHHQHLRASTVDALHRSREPGTSERNLWIGFYIVLAVLGAIGVTVGLLQQSPPGEALPPPPPGAR